MWHNFKASYFVNFGFINIYRVGAKGMLVIESKIDSHIRALVQAINLN